MQLEAYSILGVFGGLSDASQISINISLPGGTPLLNLTALSRIEKQRKLLAPDVGRRGVHALHMAPTLLASRVVIQDLRRLNVPLLELPQHM